MTFSKEAFHAWLDSNGEVPFDIYAQNPDEWSDFAAVIPGLVVASAGGMLPFQAEGLLLGLPFYFRMEWGYADLRVGAADADMPYLLERALYTAGITGLPEFVTNGREEFKEAMLQLVPKLEPSPFLWRFHAREVKMVGDESTWDYEVLPLTPKDGQRNIHAERHGWGFTPEEGYLASQHTYDSLVERGFTLEKQHQLWLDQEVDPVPLNADDRVYPAVKPDFRVIL